jgi:hypothetical protein
MIGAMKTYRQQAEELHRTASELQRKPARGSYGRKARQIRYLRDMAYRLERKAGPVPWTEAEVAALPF